MAIHPLRHRRTQKRRLFAGRLEQTYLREERLRGLQEGRKPRRRRLIAGRPNASLRREERMRLLAEGKVPARYEYARHLRGQFGGYNRDPRIKRQ